MQLCAHLWQQCVTVLQYKKRNSGLLVTDTFLITTMLIDIHMGDVGSECSGSVSAAVTAAVGSTKSSADRETSS